MKPAWKTINMWNVLHQNKPKQNGTMETVLTKLYSKEMVTKNKPKCEE